MDKQKMLEFLLKETGLTEEEIQSRMVQDKIKGLLSSNLTIGELYDQAKQEGWLDVLRATKLNDLQPRKDSKQRAADGGRLTKVESEKLSEAILVFLKSKPGSGIGDIAHAVGYDSKKTRGQLMKLKKENKIVSTGTLKNTVYKLK